LFNLALKAFATDHSELVWLIVVAFIIKISPIIPLFIHKNIHKRKLNKLHHVVVIS